MTRLIKKNHFLFLAMLAFIFVSSSALVIAGDVPNPIEEFIISKTKQTKIFPPIPVLASESTFPVLSAQGVLAIDVTSGISLYEKNSDALLLPASTTKIITALVAMDTYSLAEVLTVPKEAKVIGQKMGLFTGEKMTVENLLYGLLVYSANDAAETLAYNYPGGYESFINAMNQKAKDLNMLNTYFDNPVGLDSNVQRSTAKDLVRASEVAMRNDVFRKIVSTQKIVVTDTLGTSKHYLKNINILLGTVPGVVGVKTGWTENARENLVTYLERDGTDGTRKKVMIALLGSQDRFGETKELIDWIFTNYNWNEVKLPD